jgi:hypothetical protein
MLNANMVPAPALCASQDDMYDTATRLCRVGNKYAYWYMLHKDWVQCAPNLPGYAVLEKSVDANGNYWYGEGGHEGVGGWEMMGLGFGGWVLIFGFLGWGLG